MRISNEQWEKVLSLLETEYEIMPITFNTFVSKITYLQEKNNTFIIEAPDEATYTMINKKYINSLKDAIKRVTGSNNEVILIVKGKNLEEEFNKLTKTKGYTVIEKDENTKYTFDNFIVGKHNEFAHATAVAVAEMPGVIYNPLFIHGGVGLGKTHLMRAIAHHIKQNDENLKVLYVTSEAFTNELINAIKRGQNEQFRNKYRNIDVLLIDDIQFISDKESTQSEFFHTFNELYESKKQIIISSDRPPKEIEKLELRIRNRFELGSIVDISLPDYETRVAILRKKTEMENIELSDDVINYIATNINQSIRELEGAIKTILAYKNLMSQKENIDLDTTANILKNIVSPNNQIEITPQLIIGIVSNHYNIASDKIIGNKRTKDIAFARHVVMYLCRELTDCSLKEIGNVLNGRDHSTILNGCNNIQKEIEKNESIKRTIEILSKKITRK